MSRLAIIYTRGSAGLDSPLVTVEVHISAGLPRLSIVGLAETEVRESKDRVRSAILNSQLEFPSRRITVNLAPADLPKEGGRFDLPIALGILVATGQLTTNLITDYEFAGELALSGELRGFKGVLPFAIATRNAQRKLIIPCSNANEASIPQDNEVFAAHNLTSVYEHLMQIHNLPSYKFTPVANIVNPHTQIDMQDIQGQTHAKRALEIAAAGRHNLLMIGPPGTGKTMLASRLPTIMPELTVNEALEVAAIYSLLPANPINFKWRERPFRAPHHTASAIAMVGGGSNPKPGEISLAHHGVLFLDEIPEFERRVLEVLREPMEAGSIIISRAMRKAIFPAKFQLIAAMNPCPCGHLGNQLANCRCSNEQITRYKNKLSSPLLERIDMHIQIPIITAEILMHAQATNNEPSATIRQRVIRAINIQYARANKLNSLLSNQETKSICILNNKAQRLMQEAIGQLNLSARSFYRVLKVARTIADLEESHIIEKPHILESLSFKTRLDFLN